MSKLRLGERMLAVVTDDPGQPGRPARSRYVPLEVRLAARGVGVKQRDMTGQLPAARRAEG
ncbi:hypothetical protein ACHWUR_28580 [Klebsiella pneumoniae]